MQPTPSRTPAAALRDILDNIKHPYSFTAGLTITEFCTDTRALYATIRCLDIISEASRRLSSDMKERHPEIPWKAMAGAGSVFRHGYDDLRSDLVWETVKNDLEALRVAVEQKLQNFTK